MFVSLDVLFARYAEERDPEVLAEVMQRAAPGLLRLARRYPGGLENAEDALQELFLSLLRNGTNYDLRRPALPYLRAALLRHAARLARRQPVDGAAADIASAYGDPAATASRNERLAHVRAAIAALSPDHAFIVQQYVEHGRTPTEIARLLRRPAATVRVQLHRGLIALRRSLPVGFSLLAVLAITRARAVPVTMPVRFRRHRMAQLVVAAAAVTLVMWTMLATTALRLEPLANAGGGASSAATSDALGPVAADALPPRRSIAAAQSPVLAVVVRDAAGRPQSGVGVRAHPAGVDPDFGASLAVTDDNGRAVLTGLAEGTVRVATDRGPWQECRLLAGRAARIEFTISGGCDVSGEVLDERGEAATGASILVCHDWQQASEGQVVATADDAGRFALRALPQHATVAAVMPGRTPSPLQWVEDRATQHLTLRLGGPSATVRGIVVGPDGPVADAFVLVGRRPRAGHTVVMQAKVGVTPDVAVRTDAAGTFSAFGLPPGKLEVLARGCGIATAMTTVTVASGGTAHVELHAQEGRRWHGRVCDPAGRPVGNARVVAQALAQRRASGTSTANDGTFVLHGVDGRRREVTALAEGCQPAWCEVSGDGNDLHIELTPTPRRSGTLVDGDGRRVAGADWELAVDDGSTGPRAVPLAADATFAAALPHAPNVRFLVRRRGTSAWVACAGAANADPGDLRVPTAARELGTLRLHCHGFSAAQLADLVVWADAESGACPFAAVAIGGDVVEVRDVPAQPARWHLRGRHGVFPPMGLGLHTVSPQNRVLTVVAPACGWLHYRIGSNDGTPIDVARAFVVDEQGLRVDLASPAGRIALPVGRWRLWASTLHTEAVCERPFVIRSGEATDLETLAPPARPVALGFWLPASVTFASASVRIQRGDEVIARTDLGTSGLFLCGLDRFCAAATTLADGEYQLELSDGAARWRGHFVVRERSDEEPAVVQLSECSSSESRSRQPGK